MAGGISRRQFGIAAGGALTAAAAACGTQDSKPAAPSSTSSPSLGYAVKVDDPRGAPGYVFYVSGTTAANPAGGAPTAAVLVIADKSGRVVWQRELPAGQTAGNLRVQWDALAHVPVSDSPAKYSQGQVFDPYHMNSIATFALGEGVEFAYQHDVEMPDANTVTLFDNHFEGNAGQTGGGGVPSSLKWIRLDPAGRTTTLLRAQPLVFTGDTVHAVWNGATAVRSWRLRHGQQSSAMTVLATVDWAGYDTALPLNGASDGYYQLQPLDAGGNVVGQTPSLPHAS